jgi:ATP-dependent Clp protease ATP-binding subunit ClpA
MLPLSESASVVFAAGEQEASLLTCNYLGTEHILLGMLATKNDVSDVLESGGVRYRSVREAVKRLLRIP